jgi:hypothetical protein
MPPYDRSLELRDQIGLEPLGLATNEIWHDDPRQLGVLLARYKFVAQMLVDRQDVGELGCADAFGTRIVLQASTTPTPSSSKTSDGATGRNGPCRPPCTIS